MEPSDRQRLLAAPEAAGASITLDPPIFSDLEEELIEVGFSPEAVTQQPSGTGVASLLQSIDGAPQ